MSDLFGNHIVGSHDYDEVAQIIIIVGMFSLHASFIWVYWITPAYSKLSDKGCLVRLIV